MNICIRNSITRVDLYWMHVCTASVPHSSLVYFTSAVALATVAATIAYSLVHFFPMAEVTATYISAYYLLCIA